MRRPPAYTPKKSNLHTPQLEKAHTQPVKNQHGQKYINKSFLKRSPMSHFLNSIVSLQSFIVFSVIRNFWRNGFFSLVFEILHSFIFWDTSLSTHHHHMESPGSLIFNMFKCGLLISLLKFSPYIVFLISINTNSTLPVSQIKTLEQVLTLFFIPDPKFCPSNVIFMALSSKYI